MAERGVMGAWRPMNEAPHGETVLLAWPEPGEVSGWTQEVGAASWGWRTPKVSNVSHHGRATHWMPLPAPPTTSDDAQDAGQDLPWGDCKVAYDVADQEAVWEWHAAGAKGLPSGWELNETDCSGARCVVVFRVSGMLRARDGEIVADLVAAIARQAAGGAE